MNDKVEFCSRSLIDQMAQWEQSLHTELTLLRTIKHRVVTQDKGEMDLNDRVWVNKHVDEALELIQEEFNTYRAEIQSLSQGRVLNFLEIIAKYESLSQRFQSLNVKLQKIYTYSDELFSLKQESAKKNRIISPKKGEENILLNQQPDSSRSVPLISQNFGKNSKQLKNSYIEHDAGYANNVLSNVQFEDDVINQENEFGMTFQQQEFEQQYQKPTNSYLIQPQTFQNETFTSVQKRQHSQHLINELKSRHAEQQKMGLSASESKRVAKQSERQADFEKELQSDWFGNLKRTHAISSNNDKTFEKEKIDNTIKIGCNECQSVKHSSRINVFGEGGCQTTKNVGGVRSGSMNDGDLKSRGTTRNASRSKSVTRLPQQLSYHQRKMSSGASFQADDQNQTAFSLLRREISRIKQLVEEQELNFKIHKHKNIEEEIKKHKLENAKMKTQCQILKDENEELLVEFQKAKKIVEEQIKLSKELQDRLTEQEQSIKQYSSYQVY